jgi:hypothetical protein
LQVVVHVRLLPGPRCTESGCGYIYRTDHHFG